MTPQEFGEYIDELVDRLRPLGEGAADLGGQVFDLAVRQSYIVGIVWAAVIVAGAALSGFAIWCFIKSERVNENVERRSEKDEKWDIIGTLAGIPGGLGFLVGLVGFLSTGLPQLLNPHWYGLQRILDSLGLG